MPLGHCCGGGVLTDVLLGISSIVCTYNTLASGIYVCTVHTHLFFAHSRSVEMLQESPEVLHKHDIQNRLV